MNDLGTVFPCYSVRFERVSKHSPARLWRAITDPAEVETWMGYPTRIDLRPGGEYFLDFGRTGGGELDGVIVAIEPERLLRYAWGWSVVDWTIQPEGDGCRHVFVQNGLSPRDIPEEEGLAAGWHAFLAALDSHLAGEEFTDADNDVLWNSLKPQYRAMLAEIGCLEPNRRYPAGTVDQPRRSGSQL